jgi:hypothetical protein
MRSVNPATPVNSRIAASPHRRIAASPHRRIAASLAWAHRRIVGLGEAREPSPRPIHIRVLSLRRIREQVSGLSGWVRVQSSISPISSIESARSRWMLARTFRARHEAAFC